MQLYQKLTYSSWYSQPDSVWKGLLHASILSCLLCLLLDSNAIRACRYLIRSSTFGCSASGITYCVSQLQKFNQRCCERLRALHATAQQPSFHSTAAPCAAQMENQDSANPLPAHNLQIFGLLVVTHTRFVDCLCRALMLETSWRQRC